MRRFRASLVTFTALLLLLVPLIAEGWTWEDCVEVNFDHPDCDQYPTTTQPVTTTTAEVTTTTAEVTTTTAEVTTTTTPNVTTTQPTTTETQPPPTTTTIQECPPGTIHQPPFCVTTTVPHFDTTTTAPVPPTDEPPAELPETGAPLVLLAALMAGGFVVGPKFLKWARRPG